MGLLCHFRGFITYAVLNVSSFIQLKPEMEKWNALENCVYIMPSELDNGLKT